MISQQKLHEQQQKLMQYFKYNKMSSIRDFVPLAKLGEGTFSTVYKVRRLSDQKIYALKKVRLNNLSQKQKENALNQIRILASFQCDTIVAYKQAFFDDKLHVLCIVMEYADGGDLHRYITETKKQYRKVTELVIWKVAADILGALQHLHGKGILHRDLKSANIFIHGDQYKLGDLNVSKVNGGKLAYTQTGTPYYASPQVWRDQPYDHRSDIWSFGCILYELACLRPPFQGRDMDQLFRNVQKSSYPAIPQDYSIQLAELIDQCLQKNPKNRPKASQLLQHSVISRFRNRKNSPLDQNQTNQQLLQTIKLPTDLRALKMNLPGAKYEDKKVEQMKQLKQLKQNPKLSRDRYQSHNFVSDRPNYQPKPQAVSSNLQNLLKNQSHVVQPNLKQSQSPRGINQNQSEVFLSPRNNIKKGYEYQSLNRSPEQIINRKIASAHISLNNSDKKQLQIQSTDRKVSTEHSQANPNYSDRRANSSKKVTISQKYDKFIQQQLEKKPNVMPRTEKRIVSSQGKPQYQNQQHGSTPACISPSQNIDSLIGERKDIQEWRRKLVKKSRVFSNNIFVNRAANNVSHEVR